MKPLSIREHTRIVRSDTKGFFWRGNQAYLENRLYDRLKCFDQRGHKDTKSAHPVFLWGDGRAKTMQWVGVIQVSGLQIEILPKVDESAGNDDENQVRSNLLYILAIAGRIPVRERDVARLTSRKASLSETLAAIFADRLRSELLIGPERSYLRREENLRRFKGKLLLAKQIRHNAAHRERFFCRFDEFSENTVMNRIFRTACQILLSSTHTPSTQEMLRHCLLLLDGVEDVFVYDKLFEKVSITRQNERFAAVFHFCKLILRGRSPTVRAGDKHSFSLLFDMNRVFEEFVAAFIQKRVMSSFPGQRLFPQARGERRPLMIRDDGDEVLRLRPDLLIKGPDNDKSRLVLDTKWKRISGDLTPTDSDLYQLYAYTRRYGCYCSALLYPRPHEISGRDKRDFDALDSKGDKSGKVLVRFIDLRHRLHTSQGRESLAEELVEIIKEGLLKGSQDLSGPAIQQNAA